MAAAKKPAPKPEPEPEVKVEEAPARKGKWWHCDSGINGWYEGVMFSFESGKDYEENDALKFVAEKYPDYFSKP